MKKKYIIHFTIKGYRIIEAENPAKAKNLFLLEKNKDGSKFHLEYIEEFEKAISD